MLNAALIAIAVGPAAIFWALMCAAALIMVVKLLHIFAVYAWYLITQSEAEAHEQITRRFL